MILIKKGKIFKMLSFHIPAARLAIAFLNNDDQIDEFQVPNIINL
jgi:hypothetical protein